MPPNFTPKSDPTALYRERRERAVAFWATVPPERFDLSEWTCGSTACALGHLGLAEHDGWFIPSGKSVPLWNEAVGDDAAAIYFGLSLPHAQAVFGMIGAYDFYGVDFHGEITLPDVSRKLLALPYTLPAERV